MAYIAPDSHIKLYSGVQIIPGRQIAFSSKANQTSYFASKLVQDYTPCTYVRRTYSVKAEVSMSVVKNCNYISFTNPDFENVTWYAKIINYEYVNNACTEIFYAIDYFQTFMFDVNFEVCTIDREQLSVTDYDKSVANPYDFSIVEMRTDENIALPDEVFDFPAVAGPRAGTGKPNRTFLPSDYIGDSPSPIADAYQQQSNNWMVYTLIISSPITSVTLKSSSGHHAVDTTDSLLSDADMKSLLTYSGLDTVLSDVTGNTIPNTHLGNNIPILRLDSSTIDAQHFGATWLEWDASASEPAAFGSFGMGINGVKNQTLILATSNAGRMQGILGILAKNDIVSSIVGSYYLPLSFLLMLQASSYGGRYSTSYIDVTESADTTTLANSVFCPYTEEVHPVGFSQVKNKKLLTFPYQYIRATAPNGAQKEYRFEDFTKLQKVFTGDEDDFGVQFALLADITNTPLFEMYPYLYKMFETSFTDDMSFRHKLNIEERMEFSDFPQQAYMTDSYLAYVANQYANQMRNEPLQGFDVGTELEINSTKRELNDYYAKYNAYKTGKKGLLETIGNGLTAAGEAAKGFFAPSAVEGTILSAKKSGMDVMSIGMNHADTERTLKSQERALNLRGEANYWANSGEIGNALSDAKPAFRANNYMAGGGSGTLPYFLNGFKFTFDVMKLKDSFLQKFDDYFTNYGYKSTRTGVPHIATYLGGTKTGNAPKFLQNEQGYYVTYIKTVDCKIYSTMDMITEFFEGLFDSGIQLIDGDTLLS